MDIPPGSKVRYPDLVGYPSLAIITVPPSGYFPKFLPPPYGECLTSPLQATLVVTLFGGDPLFLGGVGAVGTYVRPKVIRS